MAEFDSGYKLLFSHPELVADLLRGFVPEPWVAEPEQLEQWGKRLLEAPTVEAVFGESSKPDDRSE